MRQTTLPDKPESRGSLIHVPSGFRSPSGARNSYLPYLESQKNDITEHRVDIHEDILDHQMDIGTIAFDEKLVVDARDNRTQHLKNENF